MYLKQNHYRNCKCYSYKNTYYFFLELYVANMNGSFFLFNIYLKLLFFVSIVSVFFNFIYAIFNFIVSKMRNDPFIKKWFLSSLCFENSIYKFKVSQSNGSEIFSVTEIVARGCSIKKVFL